MSLRCLERSLQSSVIGVFGSHFFGAPFSTKGSLLCKLLGTQISTDDHGNHETHDHHQEHTTASRTTTTTRRPREDHQETTEGHEEITRRPRDPRKTTSLCSAFTRLGTGECDRPKHSARVAFLISPSPVSSRRSCQTSPTSTPAQPHVDVAPDDGLYPTVRDLAKDINKGFRMLGGVGAPGGKTRTDGRYALVELDCRLCRRHAVASATACGRLLRILRPLPERRALRELKLWRARTGVAQATTPPWARPTCLRTTSSVDMVRRAWAEGWSDRFRT